jgi:hypothetical protein
VKFTSCATLLAAAESLVAVASKNASSGEMPFWRTTVALSCKLPLVDVHDAAVEDAAEITVTVTL